MSDGNAKAREQRQIDPAIVDCSTFVSNSQLRCLDIADEMFQLVQLIFEQFVAGDPRALTETVPTTMTVYPDGSVEYGLEGLTKRSAALFGSNNFSIIEIVPNYRYKPLNERTIVFAGTVAFTLQDHEHGRRDPDRDVRSNPALSAQSAPPSRVGAA